MLRVIIDPPRPEKNLQIPQQVTDDEQHQNHAGERDDHFLADGGAIKPGEGGHEANTVVFFNLAFNQVRLRFSQPRICLKALSCVIINRSVLRYHRIAATFLWRNDAG